MGSGGKGLIRIGSGALASWAAVAWAAEGTAGERGLSRMVSWFGHPLFRVGETEVSAARLLLLALVLCGIWWLARLVRRGLNRYALRREGIDPASLYALARVSVYVLYALGMLLALSVLGIDFGKLALVAGALGVGIGFGLQGLVNNFVSGLVLLFDRSLKKGDFVELESGVVGEVKEINFRATRITTNDNIDILVPNSEFVSGKVTNWTFDENFRRVHVPFGVAYGMDKEKVRRVVLAAAESVPYTLAGVPARQPKVWLVGFGDSSLNFELVVWVTAEGAKRPAEIQAAYLWAIHTALTENRIEIPFPQRDLHFRSFFGLTGASARKSLSVHEQEER